MGLTFFKPIFLSQSIMVQSIFSGDIQRLAEIKQAGRKPLTIREERFIDMDKTF